MKIRFIFDGVIIYYEMDSVPRVGEHVIGVSSGEYVVYRVIHCVGAPVTVCCSSQSAIREDVPKL
jgi:hypothetical protein